MKQNKFFSKLLSLLMVFVMLISVAPTQLALAAIGDINQGGTGGNTGGAWSGTIKWSDEEFIRASIWFAEQNDKGEVDWSNNDYVQQIGVTMDLRHPMFYSPRYGTPTEYTNYDRKDGGNTARGYTANKKLEPGNNWGVRQMPVSPKAPGKTKEEAAANAATMEFPILFTQHKNGVDAKEYFMSYSVYNELLYACQSRAGGMTVNSPQWQGVDEMEAGIYRDKFGVYHYGQYMILLEPGLFCSINGKSGAFTLRDMMVMHDNGSSILRQLVDPSRNLANSLYTKLNWAMFGLVNNGVTRITARVREVKEICWQNMGVGVVQFDVAKQQQLPVINYFYDLTASEIENSDVKCEQTLNGRPIDSYDSEDLEWYDEDDFENHYTITTPVLAQDTSLYNRRANNSTKELAAGNEYKAPLNITLKDGKTYQLIMGYMLNKNDVAGNLDKKDDGALWFYNLANKAEITNQCRAFTRGAMSENNDSKIWNKSKTMVSSVAQNAATTGITSGKLIQKSEGTLKALYGNSKLTYQAVFLYVHVPEIDTPPGGGDPPNTYTIDPPDPDPGRNEEVLGNPTNVTKMYYEDSKSTTPIKIEKDSFGRDNTYEITGVDKIGEDEYEMKQWVIVDDPNPGVPENHGTWEEVLQNKTTAENPGQGTTPGGLGPIHWSDPDRELFIKYVKKGETFEDVTKENELFLSEKRITWRHTLDDLKGIPTIMMTWEAVDGHEEHSCGGENCNGHSCNERLTEKHIHLVISNQKSVKSEIMGNVTYFKPYDINNHKEFNRSSSSGEQKFSPNYGFVIWRGKDIPTIASYKYDGTTLTNTVADKTAHDIIKNLVTREGKKPVGARNPENAHEEKQGYYMDNFTIVMGAVNKDTGLDGHTINSKPNEGDYKWSTRWSYCGKTHTGTVDKGNKETYDTDVRVDVGYGKPNTGNADVTFKSQNLKAFGIDFQNVQGFAINNKSAIKLYPYVEMLFDTTTGLTDQKVFTLGGHESNFVPKDYVEIGYKTYSVDADNSTGLLLQSKQWSVHSAASKLGKQNTVLPGGAIYRLITPTNAGKNTRTLVGMSSWLTFLPADTIEAVVEGKEKYSGTAQNNRNEALYRQVLNSFNNLDIVQIVNNTQVLQEKAGTQVVPNTSGQPTSSDAKYWLRQNLLDGSGKNAPAKVDDAIKINSTKTNEADLDVISTKEARTYYRIYSDVQGNVYVSKSTTSAADTAPGKGTILGKISKTEGEADLLAKNTEIQALNNRTKLVTNYLNSIDRNMGEDKSLEDKTWYNEAFDGICVVRVDKQIEIGFKDNGANGAARTSAIDPKLCPPIKGQSDLFSKKATSWFETDKHTNLSDEAGYVGSFKGADDQEVKIILAKMNGLYKSKTFYIPNATVMSLY